MMLTHAIIRELADYDPDAGVLVWRVRSRRWFKSEASRKSWNSRYANRPIGTPEGDALYLRCSIFDRRYKVHRVIWLWMTGEWPDGEIDHENHDRADNKWRNLRVVSSAGNKKNRPIQGNNTSGTPGVVWHNRDRKWVASIKLTGKKYHLGAFADKFDAVTARKAAERKLGFHPNHGMSNQSARESAAA